jgi:hypothetical protein
MNRRQFLYALTTFAASLGFGKILLLAEESKEGPATHSDMPIIDSRTSLIWATEPLGAGSRSWKEMEMVAKTGGVVCTWPLAFNRKTVQRVTFLDWAREALAMKQRLGIDHIGLGTGNGGLFKTSRVIEGYKDIRDMTKLAEAMLEVGLTKEDISALWAAISCVF